MSSLGANPRVGRLSLIAPPSHLIQGVFRQSINLSLLPGQISTTHITHLLLYPHLLDNPVLRVRLYGTPLTRMVFHSLRVYPQQIGICFSIAIPDSLSRYYWITDTAVLNVTDIAGFKKISHRRQIYQRAGFVPENLIPCLGCRWSAGSIFPIPQYFLLTLIDHLQRSSYRVDAHKSLSLRVTDQNVLHRSMKIIFVDRQSSFRSTSHLLQRSQRRFYGATRRMLISIIQWIYQKIDCWDPGKAESTSLQTSEIYHLIAQYPTLFMQASYNLKRLRIPQPVHSPDHMPRKYTKKNAKS